MENVPECTCMGAHVSDRQHGYCSLVPYGSLSVVVRLFVVIILLFFSTVTCVGESPRTSALVCTTVWLLNLDPWGVSV